jgi:DNA-binding NtrC family response regulator
MNSSVLVVENDLLVREALEDILSTIGLKVIGADNGDEGVAAYQALQDEIELVILDVRLPGMDGPKILKALRAINPSIKVIVSSGYDENEIAQRFKDQAPVSILKKPYNANALLTKVQDVLAH